MTELMKSQDFCDAMLWLQRIDDAKKELASIESAAAKTLLTDGGKLAEIRNMQLNNSEQEAGKMNEKTMQTGYRALTDGIEEAMRACIQNNADSAVERAVERGRALGLFDAWVMISRLVGQSETADFDRLHAILD